MAVCKCGRPADFDVPEPMCEDCWLQWFNAQTPEPEREAVIREDKAFLHRMDARENPEKYMVN